MIGYGGTEVDARSDLLLQVRLAWHAKETLRGLYAIDCPQLAERYADELADELADADCPPELRRLAAPWPAGTPPSSTGTAHGSPTDPPKRSTTS